MRTGGAKPDSDSCRLRAWPGWRSSPPHTSPHPLPSPKKYIFHKTKFLRARIAARASSCLTTPFPFSHSQPIIRTTRPRKPPPTHLTPPRPPAPPPPPLSPHRPQISPPNLRPARPPPPPPNPRHLPPLPPPSPPAPPIAVRSLAIELPQRKLNS